MQFQRLANIARVVFTVVQATFAIGVAAQHPADTQESPVAFSEVLRILEPREVEVEIQGLLAPDEINDIAARIRNSVSNNREWFMEAIKASPGPIPYDSRLGVTEAEYKRFAESDKEVRLGPVGAGRLRFELDKESRKLTIVNVKNVPQLDGVVIDVVKQQAQTRWGTLTKYKHTRNDDEDSPTGRWHAFGWKLEQGSADAGDFRSVQFQVGRHLKSNRSLLYLKARVLKPDGAHERGDAFILFK
jgi:hypothetical protein